MPKGDTKRNMKVHFEQIMKHWEGKVCLLRKITELIDDNGMVVDRSEVSETLYGIIAPIGLDDIHHAMGILEPEDMYGFFWHSAGIEAAHRVSATEMRHDHIVYEGTEYNVDRAFQTAYDLDEPIFTQFLLRKVAV